MSDIVERLPRFAKDGAGVAVLIDAAAEIERLRDVLLEAKLQIDYLHAKFKPTGTGEATLARIRAALVSPADRGTP